MNDKRISVANDGLLNNRQTLATHIAAKLKASQTALKIGFETKDRIPSSAVDQLLPAATAQAIYTAFPNTDKMLPLQDWRESKYVFMQMDQGHPLLAEIVYAFQDPRVVALIEEITGLSGLIPDERLYAGGISAMHRGGYLNPHLDNSHGKDGQYYRVVNLLYYVSPDWQATDGGNLELWDQGVQQPCRTIAYEFNRLVIMVTHQTSWHSVSPISPFVDLARRRCCVNNYYFSPNPVGTAKYRHVTSFRGRPEKPFRDRVLRADSFVRNHVPRGLKSLIRKPQYFHKDPSKKS